MIELTGAAQFAADITEKASSMVSVGVCGVTEHDKVNWSKLWN